jgi:phosphohistidine phosphatase
MDLYLLRHAIAVQRGLAHYPNDDRPLTEKGIQKMKKAAQGIAKLAGNFDIILSSPLVRAYDTARITAEAVKYRKKIERCKQLLPESSPGDFMPLLQEYREHKSVLVVGHEPNMSQIVSALLGSPHSVVEFKKGAFCKIRISGVSSVKHGTLIYHVTPKQLRAMAK